MIEQEITIQMSDDPFDTKTMKVKLPQGVKLMSNKPYAIDLLKTYGIDIGNPYIKDDIKNSHSIELLDDEIVKGKVHRIYDDYILINVDSKYTAICYIDKEPTEIVNQLKPNLTIDVKLSKTHNDELVASISGALNESRKREIYESIGDDSIAFKATVKELIYGGYWVDISGVYCFMPGSLAGINKLHDFSELIDEEIPVMPITYANDKNTIVVSHKKYLKTLIPDAIEEAKENIKEKMTGHVTGTTNFGVFVQFNECLTGLIPKDDLDKETLTLFNLNTINPGDSINFWIKNIINKNRIILTQHGAISDPWEEAGKKYPPETFHTGIATKKTRYGVFVKLENKVSGLLHKSEMSDEYYNNINKGDKIKIGIKSINPHEHKISMKLQ